MQDKHVDGEESGRMAGTDLEASSIEQNDTLWTVSDVAIYLKLQPETIRSMARRGELPAIKLGKVWRFQKNAIDETLARLRLVLTTDIPPKMNTWMPSR